MDPELTAAALQLFHPMIFLLYSSSVDHVDSTYVARYLAKAARSEELYVVDVNILNSDSTPSGETRGNKAPPRPPLSELLQRQLTAIAVQREELRRRVEAQKAAEIIQLKEEYMEDGLTEEAALHAARVDLEYSFDMDTNDSAAGQVQDEEDVMDNIATTSPCVCIVNAPDSLREVETLKGANINISAVVYLRSRCFLSELMPPRGTQPVVSDKQRSKGAGSSKRGYSVSGVASSSQRSPHRPTLEERLRDHFAERMDSSTDGITTTIVDVFFHEFDFPVERLGDVGAAEAAGVPAYRPTGSTTGNIGTLWMYLKDLALRCHRFREWSLARSVVTVPSYTPLVDPEATGPASAAAPEAPPPEQRGPKRKSNGVPQRASSPSAAANDAASTRESLLVKTTKSDPEEMSEVAAARHLYDHAMSEWAASRLHCTFSTTGVEAFVLACIQQVTSTNGVCELLAAAQSSRSQLNFRLDRALWQSSCSFARGSGAEVPARDVYCQQRAPWAAAPEAPVRAVDAPPVSAGDPATTFEGDLDLFLRHSMTRLGEPSLPQTEGAGMLQLSEQPSSSIAVLTRGKAWSCRQWLHMDLQRPYHNGWLPKQMDWASLPAIAAYRSTVPSHRVMEGVTQFQSKTTFPAFCTEMYFLAAEQLYFSPPLPETEDDTESSEEEDIDSDDSERMSNGGRASRRGDEKADAPEIPIVPHPAIIDEQLRRRRIFELVRQHLRTPAGQEICTTGKSVQTAVDEVHWVSMKDGARIEVSRFSACSNQVICTASVRDDSMQFGYAVDHLASTCTSAADEKVALPPAEVPSGVRTFLAVRGKLHVSAEVFADNFVAAEDAAYAAAVQAAKQSAKAQFEMQTARPTKGSKSKDKNAAAAPTLEELEATCVAAIQRPPQRPLNPPTTRVTAAFLLYWCSATLQTQSSVPTITMTNHAGANASSDINMPVLIWDDGAVRRLWLHTVTKAHYSTDGVVQVESPNLPAGTRLVLHCRGSYATERGGDTLSVSSRGICRLHSKGETTEVLRLHSATVIPAAWPAWRQMDREDGHRLLYRPLSKEIAAAAETSVSLESVQFCEHLTVTCTNAASREWKWHITGFPPVRCSSENEGRIAIAVDEEESSIFVYQQATASFTLLPMQTLRHVSASLCVTSCRLQVTDQDSEESPGSCFLLDCTFGGLYATVHAVDENGTFIYRVSPYGQCSEEKDDMVLLPPEYPPTEKTPAFLPNEPVSPLFLTALSTYTAGGSAMVPLHQQRHPSLLMRPSAAAGLFSTLKVPSWSSFLSQYVSSTSANSSTEFCCVVSAPSGESELAIMDTCTLTKWLAWVQNRCGANAGLRLTRSAPASPIDSVEEYQLEVVRAESEPLHGNGIPAPTHRTAALSEMDVSSCQLLRLSPELAAAPVASMNALSISSCITIETAARLLSSQKDTHEEVRRDVSEEVPPLDRSGDVSTVNEAKGEFSCMQSIDIGVTQASKRILVNYWTSPLHQECSTPTTSTAVEEVATPSKVERDEEDLDSLSVESGTNAQMDSSPLNAAQFSTDVHSAAAATVPSKRADCIPLMHTYTYSRSTLGATASSYNHKVSCTVTPKNVDFGNLRQGRKYTAALLLSNTSTVPYRYRVRVPADVRSFFSAEYPHRFIAPGMTVSIVLLVSGYQPLGIVNTEVSIHYEGGASTVHVWWCTTDEEAKVYLGKGVSCTGPSDVIYT